MTAVKKRFKLKELVDRLKEMTPAAVNSYVTYSSKLHEQAADEIERLAARVEELEGALLGIRRWMPPSGNDYEIDEDMRRADAAIRSLIDKEE